MGGGNLESVVDWTILTADGSECTGHDLPNFPDTVVFAGMAQAFDRFVVLCGGLKSSAYREFTLFCATIKDLVKVKKKKFYH